MSLCRCESCKTRGIRVITCGEQVGETCFGEGRIALTVRKEAGWWQNLNASRCHFSGDLIFEEGFGHGRTTGEGKAEIEPLFPGDAKNRALIRRLISEVDNYFDEAADKVITQAFFTKPEERDEAKLAAARKEVVEEYALFTKAMRGEFLAGPLSAADYALYPLVAFMNRCETKLPDLNANGMLTAELAAWKARIEALPYLASTIPPHWKQ